MTDRPSHAVIERAARMLDMTPDRVRFALDVAPRVAETVERLEAEMEQGGPTPASLERIPPLPDAERAVLETIIDGVIDEEIFDQSVVRMLLACWALDNRVRAAYGDGDA